MSSVWFCLFFHFTDLLNFLHLLIFHINLSHFDVTGKRCSAHDKFLIIIKMKGLSQFLLTVTILAGILCQSLNIPPGNKGAIECTKTERYPV